MKITQLLEIFNNPTMSTTPTKKVINTYATEILEAINCSETENYIFGVDTKKDMQLLLNRAKDWAEYSKGGCSLCYENEIAERIKKVEIKKAYNDLLLTQSFILKRAAQTIIVVAMTM